MVVMSRVGGEMRDHPPCACWMLDHICYARYAALRFCAEHVSRGIVREISDPAVRSATSACDLPRDSLDSLERDVLSTA
jgi:hypothetical protein